MPSDTYILTISDAGVSVPATDSVTNASVAAGAAIAFSKLASLTSGNILVGNSSNVPTAVAVTGDVTVSNAGVTAIASGAIVNADVNASAAIAHSKLASMSSGNILVGSSGTVPTSVAVTGDITVSSSGVTAIASDAVTFAKMQNVSGYTILGKPTTGSGDVAEIGSSSFMLEASTGFLRQADAAAARSTLGLGTLATLNSLTVATGGTEQTSYAIGDILYASGSTALSKLADVATGSALLSGGVGVAPAYGKVGLTTHVSGTLPVGSGGTGQGSYGIGDILYASGSTALSKLASGAANTVLRSTGLLTAPSYGKVVLTTDVSGTLPVANGGTANDGTAVTALTFDTLKFKTASQSTGALSAGQLRWNSSEGTLDLKMTGTSSVHKIGQEVLMGATSTTSILKGQVVYILSSFDGRPDIDLASNNSSSAKEVIGVASEALGEEQFGYVTMSGIVSGLNLTGYTAGQEVWLSTSGSITATEPTYPAHKVRVGFVTHADASTGSIYVAPKYFENGLVGATGKIGYTIGSGGYVEQSTNKSTPVTLNKTCGWIIMNGAALASGHIATFVLNNTKIEAGDVLILNHVSGGTVGKYSLNAQCGAGTANISVTNVTSGSASEAIVIAFVVIKAVTS